MTSDTKLPILKSNAIYLIASDFTGFGSFCRKLSGSDRKSFLSVSSPTFFLGFFQIARAVIPSVSLGVFASAILVM